MNFKDVFLDIGIFVFIIGTVALVAGFIVKKKEKHDVFDNSAEFFLTWGICWLIGMVSVGGDFLIENVKKSEYEQQEKIQKIEEEKKKNMEDIKEKAHSEYKVYLNGIEVDIDNINLEYYQSTIDNEQKKILLTGK